MKKATFRWMTLVAAAALGFPGCSSSKPEPPPIVHNTSTTQLATVTPGQHIVFVDDFETVKPEWQQTGGVWETQSGLLVQKSEDPRELNAIRFIQAPRVTDAVIETEVKVRPYIPAQWTNSPQDEELRRSIRYIVGAGIVFRRLDRNNFYMFRLAGEEGAVLGKMVDGDWKDIANPRVVNILQSDRIGFKNNVYRLKVVLTGARIQCFINGEPIIDVTEASQTVGHVGLVTFKTAAEFDFFKVTQ